MNPNQKDYIIKLNQTTGDKEQFKRLIRGRLLDEEGPTLSYDEFSPFDLIELAYLKAPDEKKEAYIHFFKEQLIDFQINELNNPVEKEKATLLAFSLYFFERIEINQPIREYLKRFLNSFLNSEAFFRENVPSLSPEISKDLYLQIERFRLKLTEFEENRHLVFNDKKRFENKDRKKKLLLLEKNQIVLEAFAKHFPDSIKINELFEFYEEVEEILDEEEQKLPFIQETFLSMGVELNNQKVEKLFKDLCNWLKEKLEPEDINLITKIEYFLELMWFLLLKDKNNYKLWSTELKEILDNPPSYIDEDEDYEVDDDDYLINKSPELCALLAA